VGKGTILRTGGGRIRLVWRLFLFLIVATMLTVALAAVVPTGLTGSAAATLAGAVGAGVLALWLDGRSPGALGFYLARSVPAEASRGLAVGVLLAMVVIGAIAEAGGARWQVEGGSGIGWAEAGARALALFALPAAAEEALLRGYLLQALAEIWGAGWALWLTSVAFGALHIPNPGSTVLGAINTGAAGLFLGAIYLRTGSLWWAAGAHLGWNWTLGFLADLRVSGLDLVNAPLVQGVSTGPGWLGGGTFGPEGSVLATFGFLGAAAMCWWGPWLRPTDAARSRRPLALREPAGGKKDG
jgi:membrane protease YdiL (CAAX protease family)